MPGASQRSATAAMRQSEPQVQQTAERGNAAPPAHLRVQHDKDGSAEQSPALEQERVGGVRLETANITQPNVVNPDPTEQCSKTYKNPQRAQNAGSLATIFA